MIVNPGIRRTLGRVTPIMDGLVGWWKHGDWTESGERASGWNDSSGNARHLLQAAGAYQPIALPWSGENYYWSTAAAGNSATTPATAALIPDGDLDLRVHVAMDNWSPTAASALAAVYGAAGIRSFLFEVSATGLLRFYGSSDGTTANDSAKAATASLSSLANFSWKWVRVYKNVTTGGITFYTSDDGSTWVQLGDVVAGAVYNFYQPVNNFMIGGYGAIPSGPCAGKFKRVMLYDGTTLVADFNPTLQTEGATSWAAATTGETWTVNTSGAKQAFIVGSQQLVGDGSTGWMRAIYTQDQPCTRFFVVTPVTWAAEGNIYDGASGVADSMGLEGVTGTPTLQAVSNDTGAGSLAGGSLGASHIMAVVYNGASSVWYLDTANSGTINLPAASSNGLTIMANGVGAPTPAIGTRFKEALEYNRAFSAAEVAQNMRYLNRKFNTGLAL